MHFDPAIRNIFSVYQKWVAHAHAAPTQSGFTLIELIVTMSILAIILAIAAPSFTSTVQGSRVTAAQMEFTGALTLARSEAAKRGVPVVITATAPVAGNEFGGGWTIWADLDGNGAQTVGVEPTIRVHEVLSANIKLFSAPVGTTAITFNSNGFLVPAAALTFDLCPTPAVSSNKKARFTLTPNGMPNVNTALPAACPP